LEIGKRACALGVDEARSSRWSLRSLRLKPLFREEATGQSGSGGPGLRLGDLEIDSPSVIRV